MPKVLDDFSLADLNSAKKSEISKPCQIREGISTRTVGPPAVIRLLDSSTLTNKKIPPFHFQTSAKSDVQFNTQKSFFINPSESQSCWNHRQKFTENSRTFERKSWNWEDHSFSSFQAQISSRIASKPRTPQREKSAKNGINYNAHEKKL